jgi:hypothetical protein
MLRSTAAAAVATTAATSCCLCFCQLNEEPKVCQYRQVLAVEKVMYITAALKQSAPQVQLAGLILKPRPGHMPTTAATAAATRLSFTAAAAASDGPGAAPAAVAAAVTAAATATCGLPWC